MSMVAEPKVEFSLPARAENVALIRHTIAGFAEALEMEGAEIADLKTVVSEACMNVVNHAYEGDQAGPMEVDAWPDGHDLVVKVRDFGAGIRPLADVERRSLRLGLSLMAALTSSFEISRGRGGGTEIRLRMPLAANGAGKPAEVPAIGDETRINLKAGGMLAPILARVISMFAARADFSVDELSDAVLLSDAISAGGSEGFPDGTARVAVSEQAGSFLVRVGPLDDGGGQKLLERMRIPALEASLEDLADEVEVETGEGGEVVAIRIGRQAGAGTS